MSETSSYWPYIRAIAKAVTVPGTRIGLSVLTDIQDELSNQEFKEALKGSLGEIESNTHLILSRLHKEDICISDQALLEATVQLAESIYLDEVANAFLYADFRGIEQIEKHVPLKLDDIFVDLRVSSERSFDDVTQRERRLVRQLTLGDENERPNIERELASIDAARSLNPGERSIIQSIDRALRRPGGVVILGGPGSGKTTLMKRLARSCALGTDELRDRYPALPWCFPVLIPVARYDDEANGRTMIEFMNGLMAAQGGTPLHQAFQRYWSAGQCLVLLDGLDEVVDASRRIACARSIETLFQQLSANRAVVTSRPIGYSVCRLCVPADHLVLQPMGREDVDRFARHWHLAYDRAVHPDNPRPEEALSEAKSLIDSVRTSPQIESLAFNPLMLTIISLIKMQNVILPKRRVQLYEIAVNTLLRGWDRARSLANRANHQSVGLEETKKLWGNVAFWMHRETSRGTCHRQKLHQYLVEVLMAGDHDRLAAESIAESYIDTAAETSGLLEERGGNYFAFLHQTFEEYLAAYHLATDQRTAIQKLVAIAGEPRWHEVVRLAAGVIGVVHGADGVVTDLVEALVDAKDDVLEPCLCRRLHVAAMCVSDDVRVRKRTVGKIIDLLCDKILSLSYELPRQRLTEALENLHVSFPPGAITQLTVLLARGPDSASRRAAAKLLSYAANQSEIARKHLDKCTSTDPDMGVRAVAAFGLICARESFTNEQAITVMKGANTALKGFRPEPPRRFLDYVSKTWQALAASFYNRDDVRVDDVQLMESLCGAGELLAADARFHEVLPVMLEMAVYGDPYVSTKVFAQIRAWGPRPSCIAALRQTVRDHGGDVREMAATVLGEWGYKSEGVDVLKSLANAGRMSSISILTSWGYRSECRAGILANLRRLGPNTDRNELQRILISFGPDESMRSMLRKVLTSKSALDASVAVAVLASWGLTDTDVTLALRLCREGDAAIKSRSLDLVVRSGCPVPNVSDIAASLDNPDPYVRFQAASIMGQNGYRKEAYPVLVELVEQASPSVWECAAQTLATWDLGDGMIPNVKRLLSSDDEFLRFRAARLLGTWGQKEVAIPALRSLLKSATFPGHSLVRGLLQAWGTDPGVIKFCATVLERASEHTPPFHDAGKFAFDILRAAQGRYGSAALLLSQLTSNALDEVADFFDTCEERIESKIALERIAPQLRRVIEPQESDTQHMRSLREIVLNWVWDAVVVAR